MIKTTTHTEKPRLIWSMKRRVEGKWENFTLNLLAGKTLRQVNQEQEGQDVVAELVIAEGTCYLCGTDELKARMSKKGKAVTFSEASIIMETVAPGDLDLICPPVPGGWMDKIEETFPGATLVNVKLD